MKNSMLRHLPTHGADWRPALYPIVVLAFVACLGGCGNPHGTVKVTGRVTVDGEAPPGEGTITFTVVEPEDGFPSRPAMARFGKDGTYSTTTYDPGDGLLPGTYKVAVECYETAPNMEGIPVKSFIDSKFINGDTSGLELTVKSGSKPIEFNIDVTKGT